ncbi:MAG TPA: hypothetical protein VEC35_11350 [Noviherbaspirillum sp.]|nr:hypothetical protein [Noviherbaspirillum sp.]
MDRTTAGPTLTNDGVTFTVVTTDFVKRDCLVSNEALAQLSSLASGTIDPMATFHVFEAKIQGVARRLVNANVPGSPLRLGPQSFR